MSFIIGLVIGLVVGVLSSYLVLRNNAKLKAKVDVLADKGEVEFDKRFDK